MLICDNLTCARGHKRIFNHLGFCLQAEALLLLKGANGSGKTSLLECLAGVLPVAEGEVTWNGKPIARNAEFVHDMMLIGHAPEAERSSVAKMLLARARKHDTEMLVPAALKYYDLEPYKDTPLKHLSMGWRRRAMLAQLIVAPCKLWLLDEPTDFLDEDAVLLTVSLIEARICQGGIVIAASHSLKSGIEAHGLDLGDFTACS